MSIFKKIKNILLNEDKTSQPDFEIEKSSVPLEYGILSTNTAPFSADFSQGYIPSMAEDSKFVVADTTDDAYAGYPTSTGFGKYVQLAHIIPSVESVDFSKSYNPGTAENGKFVQLDIDPELGWPENNYPKYAVLTYIVNPDALQLQGGTLNGNLNLSGNDIFNVGELSSLYIETNCGNSTEWCSTYTTVQSNSGDWSNPTLDYLSLSGGVMSGNIDMGGGTITNASLIEFVSASFITELSGFSVSGDIEIDGNSTITGLISTADYYTSREWYSTYTTVQTNSADWIPADLTEIASASADWNSTYTTVQTNSASNWDNDLTLKLDQTTPQTVINGAPIFNGGIESYLKDYSGVLAVDTIGRTLNDDSGAIITTWDDSGVSIVGCLSTDCIKPESTLTTPISVHSSLFMVSGGGGIEMQDSPISNLHYIDWHLDDSIPPAEGRLTWNDNDGTLDLGLKGGNVNLQIGQETVLRVRASEDIADGEVVYIDGASGQTPTAGIASKDDLISSHSVIGVATETIANNNFGYITTQGLVRGIDTSNIPIGQIAYLGTAGALVSSAPITPDHEVRVGVIVNSNTAPNGILYVDVSLGFDINEIHDINITSPADNDVLLYSSVSSAWLNSDQANNWDSTYTTVQSTSGSWGGGGGGGSSTIESETTTTFTINTSSEIVLVDATAGASTVNLLPAVSNEGKRQTVKKIDSTANTVTLSANTNIEGQATFIINNQYDAIEVISNGAQWWII